MARSSSAAVATLVAFYAGLALVIVGVLLLGSSRSAGLGLMGGGVAVVVLGALLSPRARREADDGDVPDAPRPRG